jgi:hypothetical protein
MTLILGIHVHTLCKECLKLTRLIIPVHMGPEVLEEK